MKSKLEMRIEIERLQQKLNMAIGALEFYADEEVYSKPESFNCAKMGRKPELDDCDEVSYIASDVLEKIRGEE